MAKYEVSTTHFFRETGQKVEAGDIVELTEEQAAENNERHPGLLKAVRKTTQGQVTAVRVQPEATPSPRKRVRRAKK